MKPSQLLSTLLIGVSVACQKDTLPVPASANPGCFDNNPVSHQAKNLKGIVGYRQDMAIYTINYHVPGTIDSQWTGLTCNLPASYQTVGKEVRFTGEYRTTSGKVAPRLGGEQIYYLYLSSVK